MHPKSLDFSFPQDFRLHAFVLSRNFLGAAREVGRCADVRRQIAKIPGERHTRDNRVRMLSTAHCVAGVTTTANCKANFLQ